MGRTVISDIGIVCLSLLFSLGVGPSCMSADPSLLSILDLFYFSRGEEVTSKYFAPCRAPVAPFKGAKATLPTVLK